MENRDEAIKEINKELLIQTTFDFDNMIYSDPPVFPQEMFGSPYVMTLEPFQVLEINKPTVEITLNHPEAKVPEKSDENAGYDLFSIEEANIRPGMRVKVNTGISLAIPQGWVGLIWPKSGHATKHGLDVLAGVIDWSYRGDIIVCLLNTGSEAIHLPKGAKVAQYIIQEYKTVNFKVVEKLSETNRGAGAFGSTGL
jgi:dUTP pyrophosphatase